jgi:glucosamine--fructose-6-phosphate aminotransferase (isomerizing)
MFRKFAQTASTVVARQQRHATQAALRTQSAIASSQLVASLPTVSRANTGSESGDARANLSKLLAIATGAAFLATQFNQKESKCCGIAAIVGNESTEASQFLMEGITILQNRGYDSAGIATLAPAAHSELRVDIDQKPAHDTFPLAPLSASVAALDHEIVTSKYASVKGTADSIHLLRKSLPKHKGHHVGIAHTRWATHGGKTDYNSHPHSDMAQRISVVHNGTITNFLELKNELQESGVEFRSQTDTEVIAQLIGSYVRQGHSVIDAVKSALPRLQGTYGLCIMDKQCPERMIVSRNGSPIVIGKGREEMYVASEVSAFQRYTKQFMSLQDGEIALIHNNRIELLNEAEVDEQEQQGRLESRWEQAAELKIRLTPEPYAHWTLREIEEQPRAVAQAMNFGGRLGVDRVYLNGLESKRDELLSIDDIILTGCGTSLNAGEYGARLMRELDCFTSVRTEDSAELTRASVPRKHGGLLCISQSGETKDVHRAMVLSKDVSPTSPVFSIVNSVGSLIARTADCGVYLNAGRETAVASTKAFVTQVTVLGLVSCWFGQERAQTEAQREKLDEIMNALHKLPMKFGNCLKKSLKKQCKEVAQVLKDKEHCFVLGKGYAEPIAREGALKIKEITYLHAEGYSGGALKHGPFALIDDEHKTPVIMIVLDDEHKDNMMNAVEQVKARGATTIVITDNKQIVGDRADHVLEIPHNGPFTALLAVLPLQIIAYELALLRGINPDVPRNLAKAVTVD